MVKAILFRLLLVLWRLLLAKPLDLDLNLANGPGDERIDESRSDEGNAVW
jgi:hypothetical protein